MAQDIMALNEQVQQESNIIESFYGETSKVVVGQKYMIERILIGLLSDGHVLLEGVPGLAKTLAVKTISDVLKFDFKRIQFTPDLLPADLIGTIIYNQKTAEFTPKKGPIFSNIILADEINRAPAKVQSALLESMAEKQVTIGDHTYKLDDPFLVLATQNPIEQEGTYPLPEAQSDRFMLKLKVDYPSKEEEMIILNRMTQATTPSVSSIIDTSQILRLRKLIPSIYIDDKVKKYILDIVFTSRYPQESSSKKVQELKNLIELGASPRASIFLTKAAKAHAFLNGRGYVTPEDIKAIAYDVLRHRLLTTYEAEAEEMTSEDIITIILDNVEVP